MEDQVTIIELLIGTDIDGVEGAWTAALHSQPQSGTLHQIGIGEDILGSIVAIGQPILDPKHRGRVPIKAMLASPVLHELLELRRPDVSETELRHNWFSLAYAEMLYADYLGLDADQNGMLSAAELARYRGGGLTTAFISRIYQECQTYRNRDTGQSEIDYKSYLDFVLATTYKGTAEALGYFMRLLDLEKAGRLSAFEVCYFFRAVVEKFDEFGEEASCTVEDVKDEIFDMVKPGVPLHVANTHGRTIMPFLPSQQNRLTRRVWHRQPPSPLPTTPPTLSLYAAPPRGTQPTAGRSRSPT